MIYNLIRFISLFLPYGLLILLYKRNKALPANIRTRTGGLLKAVMVTDKYGILFTDKDYTRNRIHFLREQQNKLNEAYEQIAHEMNSLSMQHREYFFEETDETDSNR